MQEVLASLAHLTPGGPRRITAPVGFESSGGSAYPCALAVFPFIYFVQLVRDLWQLVGNILGELALRHKPPLLYSDMLSRCSVESPCIYM